MALKIEEKILYSRAQWLKFVFSKKYKKIDNLHHSFDTYYIMIFVAFLENMNLKRVMKN